MFHRLTVPTYFGGLPSGFDYINTPSLSGGTGIPAFMDGKKIGGPNDGTYAVAFGEDATSNFANRGIKALAENTDAIDNILRRDIAISARTVDSGVGHGGLAYIAIAGQVFVGTFGTPNTQEQRDLLISVLDENDNEILDSTGTKIVASAIVDNIVSSTNLVGTQASGFFDTPTIVFNVPLQFPQTFRIYYGERSNLAELPQDAFTTIKIRGAQEVSANIEQLMLSLHGSTAFRWDSPWDASIAALAMRGLNGAYRLDTSESSLPYNTPGAGSAITRDGLAPSIKRPGYDMASRGTVGSIYYPDPIMASWRLETFRQNIASNYNQHYGWDVGLYQESSWHSTYDVDEYSMDMIAGPLVLDVAPRTIRDPTLSGNPVITRITTNNVATLNPDAGTSIGALCTVQVGAGDFLRDGDGNQSIRYTDLIEVTDFDAGKIIGVFRVGSVLSDTRVQLQALPGVLPTLGIPGVASPVLLRWLQPTMQLGGRYRDAVDTSQGFPYFTIAAPAPAITPISANRGQLNAVFLSAVIDRTLGSSQIPAMAWGGFSSSGYWSVTGTLDGDGGINTNGGKQTFNLLSRRYSNFMVNEGGRLIEWNPYITGSHIQIFTNGGLTTPSPMEFSIDTSFGYVPRAGDEFNMFILISDFTQPGVLSMTWPADFNFSGLDGIIPDSYMPGGPHDPTIGVHYRFTYVDTPHSTGWYATRTDF